MSIETSQLHLITGPPGSGKTHYCLDNFNENCLIVMANGAQAEYIQEIIDERFPELIDRPIYVKEFDDFCSDKASINGVTAKLAKRPLRQQILTNCIQSAIEEGCFFIKVKEISGFHNALFQFLEDMQRQGFNSNTLSNSIKELAALSVDSRFEQRFNEICHLMFSYESEFQKRQIFSPAQLEWQCVDAINNSITQDRREIWFDGFHELNNVQIACIEAMINNKAKVHLTLDWTNSRSSLYKINDETRKYLLNKYDISETILENCNKRCSSNLINTINYNLFSTEQIELEESKLDEKLDIISASNCFSEVEYCARKIVKLTSQGIKHEDIAVVVRDWSSYGPIIAAVFARYKIPYCSSWKEPLKENPLYCAILHLLNTLNSNLTIKNVFEYFASAYLGLSRQALQKTRQDAVKAGVSSNIIDWENFRISLEDSGIFTDELQSLIDNYYIVNSKPQSLYSWKNIISGILSDKFIAFHGKKTEWHKRDENAFKSFMECTDVLQQGEGDNTYTLYSFDEYLNKIIPLWEKAEYSPSDSDKGVKILDPALTDGCCPTHLYFLGMIEGIYPRRPKEDPFLYDDEKLKLSKLTGIKIKTSLDAIESERALLLRVISLVSQQIQFSYARTGDDSEMTPALLLDDIRGTLPKNSINDIFLSHADVSPMYDDCIQAQDQTLYWASRFIAPWSDDSINAPVINSENIKKFSLWKELPSFPALFNSEANRSAQWHGEKLSVTELETLVKCPFRHFASYRMKLHPISYEENRAKQGLLIHRALQLQLSEHPESIYDEKALREGLEKKIEYILEHETIIESPIHKSLMGLFAKELLDEFAKREVNRDHTENLIPTMFELGFGEVETIKGQVLDKHTTNIPLTIKLNETETAQICGTIDRVDMDSAKTRAMIIDYKLEGSDLWSKNNNNTKINLQMPLYALALKKLFNISQISLAYDSLVNGKRDTVNPADEKDHKFFRKLAKADDDKPESKLHPFNHWISYSVELSKSAITEYKNGSVRPMPSKEKCAHCSHADLCRVNLEGVHDGAASPENFYNN